MDSSEQTLENTLSYEILEQFAALYLIAKYGIIIRYNNFTFNHNLLLDYYKDIEITEGNGNTRTMKRPDRYLTFMQKNLPTIYNELEYNIPVSEITLNPTDIKEEFKIDIMRYDETKDIRDYGMYDKYKRYGSRILKCYILNRFGYAVIHLNEDNCDSSCNEVKLLKNKENYKNFSDIRNLVILTLNGGLYSVINSCNYDAYEFDNCLETDGHMNSYGDEDITIHALYNHDEDINKLLFDLYNYRKNKFGIVPNDKIKLKTMLVPSVDFKIETDIEGDDQITDTIFRIIIK